MNDFHYNFMMKKIKPENLDLLFTDTDSPAYEIRNQDIYKIMKDNKDEFDLSSDQQRVRPIARWTSSATM